MAALAADLGVGRTLGTSQWSEQMTDSPEFSADVLGVLRRAGWQPGRRVTDHQIARWQAQLAEFELSHAARAVLEEFGGLELRESGPGIECARSPVSFDPTKAAGEGDRCAACESLTGKVFPLGEICGGHSILYINAQGSVFAIMDDVLFVGDTFAQAMERLLRGMRLSLA
jgi:hypothetical protein